MRRRLISKNPVNTNKYMTIYALEDGLQAKLSYSSVKYSLDEGETWVELPSDTYTPSVNSGQTIMFKGNLTPIDTYKGIGNFSITKRCDLKGNCNSLIFNDDAEYYNNDLTGFDYCFATLFRKCTTIEKVSKTFLPSTNLSTQCYQSMFNGCTNLIEAPELPALTLTQGCYYAMFGFCSSLESGPVLAAPILVQNCYSGLYNGCTKLRYIKMLGTTIEENVNPFLIWTLNVSPTGVFVKHPDMNSLPSGGNGIPEGWVVENSIN